MITPALEEMTPAVVWVLARRAEEGVGTWQDGGKVEGSRGTLRAR